MAEVCCGEFLTGPNIVRVRERLQNCTAITARVEFAGRARPMRVLVTEAGVFRPMLEYFKGTALGLGSQRNAVLGLGLFIDFLDRNSSLANRDRRHLALSSFAQALYEGTIDRTGRDSSRLFWPPVSASRAVVLVEALCGFLDWHLIQGDSPTDGLDREPRNWAGVMAGQRRADQRKARSLLSHLMTRNNDRFVPASSVILRHHAAAHQPPAFPDGQIWNLLASGFGMPLKMPRRVPEWNVRDAALTVLLHGTGLRISQAMHLWVDDVIEDPHRPDHAMVRIYHPSDGRAPPLLCPLSGRILHLRRREYLQRACAMPPRTEMLGTGWAGWKEPTLDDPNGEAFLPLFWYPSEWGKLFWDLWKIYLREVRPRAAQHPFAWTNLDTRYSGLPLTISSYADSRKAAVKRSGLLYGKAHGTTAHGHRHAYGRRLKQSKLSEQLIQRCMHHKSVFSQLPYTAPDIAEINRSLTDARDRLRGDVVRDGQREHLGFYPFRDVDPLGVFA